VDQQFTSEAFAESGPLQFESQSESDACAAASTKGTLPSNGWDFRNVGIYGLDDRRINGLRRMVDSQKAA